MSELVEQIEVVPQGVTSPSYAQITVERYPGTSRILHWIIAVLVLATWPLGFTIHLVKNDVSMTFYMLHEGIGFLVFWFMLIRVGNKLIARAPSPKDPPMERMAAKSVHGLFYIFLIVMPVSGFLATNAHGFPLQWFGLFEVWSPIDKTPEIAWTLSGVHYWSSWVVLALFLLHMGAVVMHHVIKRDTTLYRIL
ncbi:cytochrome b [Rhizobium sp. L1K21]|uniref:cytochrome b n=1 Tax=Rhizobium sp. L1K21 TaxID=2954933 RepID=UPI002093FA3C|nr:cytochrome b [Rhizobium sp. L1K21]MCO6184631.1 cytochrome b [Rhizobium sp. L1K21]